MAVGGNGNALTQDIMDAYQNTPSLAKIDAKYTVTNKTVDISIKIDAVADLPASSYTLHTAIIEGKTVQNVGSNGETEFHNVMKKMLPDANGKNMGTLSSGQTYTAAYNYSFKGNFRKPNNSNDPINHNIEHSVEEFTDLKVVVWIQANDGTIEQSTYAKPSLISVDEVAFTSGVKIYPNPATDVVKLELNVETEKEISVQVVNTLGQTVLTNNVIDLTTGLNTFELNTSSLEAGMYLVNITSGNQVITKTISIVK